VTIETAYYVPVHDLRNDRPVRAKFWHRHADAIERAIGRPQTLAEAIWDRWATRRTSRGGWRVM